MRVLELWRYPVKSLQGEMLPAAHLGPEGVAGDRQWAIFDVATGLGLTARRAPELLFASARLVDSGQLQITLPDGSVARDDAALSEWLGRQVALRSSEEVSTRQYENVDDFELEGESPWHAFDGSRGSFRDSERTAISLVSESSLGTWDRRRFRPNIVVSGAGEDELIDQRIAIGESVVDVTKKVGRCVMVTRPQPDGIDRDLDVLRTVHRERAGTLAIGAVVAVEGRAEVGDELITVSAPL